MLTQLLRSKEQGSGRGSTSTPAVGGAAPADVPRAWLWLLVVCLRPTLPACCVVVLQAVNGGSPTWFGITVPFDLNTLLGIVSATNTLC